MSSDSRSVDVRYTDGTYLKDNRDWGEGDAQWKARQVAGMLTKHNLAPISICDIGCGTGAVLDELRGLLPGPPSLTGYEVAPQALDLAPATRRRRIELVCGAYDVDDRSFDLLMSLDVFEHLEDYYGFLRAIRSKAPLAIFHIPIDTAVTSVLRPGPIMKSYQKVGHIQHFTRAAALEALRHSGYEVLDSEHTVPAREMPAVGVRQQIGRAARIVGAHVNVDLAARLMTGFPLLALCKTGSRDFRHSLTE